MKEKIISALINLVALALAIGLGIGGMHLWNTIKFQKAYNDNVLSMQRQQIQATCEELINCGLVEEEIEVDGK